ACGCHFLREAVNLLREGEVDDFLAAVAALPERPVLIIIDTLARCLVGGDENSAKDMGIAIAALDRLRAELGCSVLVVHHTGHANEERERGSSALRAAVDTLLVLRAAGSVITLKCAK